MAVSDAILGHLNHLGIHLGLFWGTFGGLLARLRAVLEAFWAVRDCRKPEEGRTRKPSKSIRTTCDFCFLGRLGGPLWTPLRASWRPLRPSFGQYWRHLWENLEASWAPLVCPGGHLGPSWAVVEANVGPSWPSWRRALCRSGRLSGLSVPAVRSQFELRRTLSRSERSNILAVV